MKNMFARFGSAAVVFGLLFSVDMSSAFAASVVGGQSIGQIAGNLGQSTAGITDLVENVAYLTGFVLALAGIYKLKQHKDNPQQTPLGTPILWFFLAALALFLPTFIASMGTTVWGSGQVQEARRPGSQGILNGR